MVGKRGTVFVVDCGPEPSGQLAGLIEREGFAVVAGRTGDSALSQFERERPLAVLLDSAAHDDQGIELCRAIRGQDGAVPILFVGGSDDEAAVVRGLEAGADDFVPKPVRGAELIARLEAHLRKMAAVRAASVGEDDDPERHQALKLGDITIDLRAHQALVGREPARLGPLEFKLLEYLARNSGVAVSRDQIMNQVYGYDADISTERVDLLVRRVRAKLGDDDGRLITAVPGFGYRLDRRVTR